MPLLNTISPTTVSEHIVDFTSSGSFTVPSGVYTLQLFGCGGGGGGGSGASDYGAGGSAGGGQGGGGSIPSTVSLLVTPGQVFSVTIGAGGPAPGITPYVPSNGAPGSNGGDSLFGPIVFSGSGGGDGGSRFSTPVGGDKSNIEVAGQMHKQYRTNTATNSVYASAGANGIVITYNGPGTGGGAGYGAGGAGGNSSPSVYGAGNGVDAAANSGAGGGGGGGGPGGGAGGIGGSGFIRVKYVK